MKLITKLLIGIFTVYPLGYMFLGVTFILQTLKERHVGKELFDQIFIVQFATMGLIATLMIFYLLHLYQNTLLVGNSKMRWTLALIFGSFIAMPIYWWRYIYHNQYRSRK